MALTSKSLIASASSALRPASASLRFRPVQIARSSARGLATSSRVSYPPRSHKGPAAATAAPPPPTPAAELLSALDSEITHEKQNSEEIVQSGQKDVATEIMAEGVWQVVDQPGGDEIVLQRQFGSETIRVTFSAEVNPEEDDVDSELEEAEEYEDDDVARNERDTEEPEQLDTDDLDREQLLQALPVRASVSIIKPRDAGAVQLDVVCRVGELRIDRVAHFANPSMVTDNTVEADWAKGGSYGGPIFADLDPQVQDAFITWLGERGINDELATAVVDLQAYKEQKEYVHWLSKLRSFVSA